MSTSRTGGASTESGVTRIGTPGTQSATYISGIRGVTTGANDATPVVIDSHGQLGTAPTSLSSAVTYVRYDADQPGNTSGGATIGCPIDHPVLIGGGCGHRDNNSAQTDIVVNYSGPDGSNPSTNWRCLISNRSSDTRALLVYAICSR